MNILKIWVYQDHLLQCLQCLQEFQKECLDKFACIFDPLNYKSTDDVVIGPKAADFSANSGTQADNPHKVVETTLWDNLYYDCIIAASTLAMDATFPLIQET